MAGGPRGALLSRTSRSDNPSLPTRGLCADTHIHRSYDRLAAHASHKVISELLKRLLISEKRGQTYSLISQ